ncbi:5,10-methylenetetrahydromethanopterin reductase [Antricoccus suffuscus]|uniref:5,10-methylenetetrahydromethanopterin reductase n=1 Tax=Antricoccus suffuscus TaxID=1629062 RepID=A0A2T1A2M5_9ACTN|nr:LLM class flavin-dependent oxidoreductase [Antricoccus suffuscus]PRZ42588.1 5,10-methylenetetrahydromethanopterin reductase [Antricoccus suffuscus]
MTLTMSCAFNTSMDSPEHARIAEELGYTRAWFYDSPAICADVWMQLARAADRTNRIGLGTGVLIPALRHPMITATAIANLVEVAGKDRVSIGVGTGFTGRLTLGQRPVKWSAVAAYVDAVQRLLKGEYVEWDGAKITMMHRPEFAAPRPIEVPWVAGVAGPKGIAFAKEYADGAFTSRSPVPGFDWAVHLTFGTVLDDGENPGSPRAIEAAGHAAAILIHRALEFGNLEAVPNGEQWAAAYADIPDDIRHIELHDGHLWSINDRDRPFVTGEVLEAGGVALSKQGWKERLAQLAEEGATEIAYQPAGPDVPRELEAFADAMRG